MSVPIYVILAGAGYFFVGTIFYSVLVHDHLKLGWFEGYRKQFPGWREREGAEEDAILASAVWPVTTVVIAVIFVARLGYFIGSGAWLKRRRGLPQARVVTPDDK